MFPSGLHPNRLPQLPGPPIGVSRSPPFRGRPETRKAAQEHPQLARKTWPAAYVPHTTRGGYRSARDKARPCGAELVAAGGQQPTESRLPLVFLLRCRRTRKPKKGPKRDSTTQIQRSFAVPCSSEGDYSFILLWQIRGCIGSKRLIRCCFSNLLLASPLFARLSYHCSKTAWRVVPLLCAATRAQLEQRMGSPPRLACPDPPRRRAP